MSAPAFTFTPAPVTTAAATSPAAFDYLRQMVYAASAIVLEKSKDYLLESRLTPVLAQERLPSFDALVDRLSRPGNQALRTRVIEAMTTNETFFFRDIHPFEMMRKVVLPEIAASGRDRRTLSIWSAASSSGQEIYSLAMLMHGERLKFDGWNVRFMGSDLSTEILAKARAAKYSQMEVNRGLPAPMLLKHFDKVGIEWQVKEELRRQVTFRPLNLIEPWPTLPIMDVVFLRNVLIYFDVDTKRRILDKLAGVMRPGAYLFLGGVETTLNLSTRFTEVRADKSTCYRLAS